MSSEQLLNMFECMVKIRKFEVSVSKLYANNELPGFVHLYIGEEAIAAGVCANLRKDDYITSTHRGHGHLIAKGGDLKLMMAELYGKETGYCKGKGGSMHIADLDLGILGANGIVGGGLPIAVGAGYSTKILKTDHVSVAFFGDGATNEGTFHESMNMAAAWKLPVVFICENNNFGVSTRIDRVTGNTDLAKRAIGYGMESIKADGNDVEDVFSKSKYAIDKARNGEGPTLIVADTFRHHGHFEGEVVTYWEKSELESWKLKDPIDQFRRKYISYESDIEKIERKVDEDIQDAIDFARKSDYPKAQEALEDLFYQA